MEYLPIQFTETEKMDITDLASANPSFMNVWQNKVNLTDVIIPELRNILHGVIPRSFVINIKGFIGRQTGVFKSSFGSQLALDIDPTFNIKERVALNMDMLLEKIKLYANKKQIFLLDERVRDFKQGAELRLANIIESCREKQLCFILCGVPELTFTFSDYHFERLGESSDEYMNKSFKVNNEEIISGKKTVYYLVKKITENQRYYRGYLKWNITSLENKKWNDYWSEYMILKRQHQTNAINSSLTGFDFKRESEKLIKSESFKECFMNDKLSHQQVKSTVYSMYPDHTIEERRMIYSEVIRLCKLAENS